MNVEDIHIQNTSSVIEISILETNNELDAPVELSDVQCTRQSPSHSVLARP